MTTPTSNLYLASHIQAEFGGANPAAMSEYYRGGALVPAGTATSATDGVAISTAGTIRMGMFRGVTKQAEFPTGAALITRISTNGTTTAKVSVMPDGTLVNVGNTSILSTNWRFPTQAGFGSTFWVQFDDLESVGSGFDPTGVALPLSNGGKTVGFTTSYGTHISFQFRLRISRNQAMTQVVGDATFPIALDN